MFNNSIYLWAVGLGVVLALALSACVGDQPQAQVLTTPDQAATGMAPYGAITNFPFPQAQVAIFEDVNRGTTCYVLTYNVSSSISCTLTKSSPVMAPAVETVKLVTPSPTPAGPE